MNACSLSPETFLIKKMQSESEGPPGWPRLPQKKGLIDTKKDALRLFQFLSFYLDLFLASELTSLRLAHLNLP